MKKSTKIIIIVAVAAVAAFLVWKKLKKDKSGSSDASGTEPQPGTVEYILANIPFTNAEVRKIKAVQAGVNASTTWKENIQKNAAKNGYTFDEQVVLAAIWLMYHPSQDAGAAWIAGPDGSTSYGWKLQQKVLNLK